MRMIKFIIKDRDKEERDNRNNNDKELKGKNNLKKETQKYGLKNQ